MILDVAAHTLHDGPRVARLTPMSARIVRVLGEAFPRYLRGSDIVSRVWTGGEPDSDVLSVHLHRLRQRVRDAGMPPLVMNQRWAGYAAARPIRIDIAGPVVVLEQAEARAVLDLLLSHPDQDAADRVLDHFREVT